MIVMTQRQEHELLEELPCFPTAGKHRSPFTGEEKGLDARESRTELVESWSVCG